MSRTPEPAASAAAPAAAREPNAAAWEPRHATAWASLIYAVCTLALGWPALAGKFLVNPYSDQYKAGYAFREFGAAMLRETGGFPLWNPYQYGGMPYVAAMHGDIFYPTFLLRLVMPTDMAMTWGFAIHLFLAGLFTYLFLRALGLGFWAAVLGGVAYSIGGNIAGLVSPGHDGKLYLSALLPATLHLLVRLVRDGRLWAWGALSFVLGMGVLTPHPQLFQYLLLLAGSFTLFLAFADTGQGKLPRRVALQRIGLAALAVVVAALIGAIQFLPVREYVAWSPRAGGHSWETATSFSLPLEEMVNFVVPQFSGILDNYWGRNGIHFHSEYIGYIALMLAVLAFIRQAGDVRRKYVWFFGGAFVLSLLWALGGSTPFYRIIYTIVPGTKFFRAPSTMLFVVAFSLAVLSAFGAERALRGDVTKRFLMGWLIAAAAIAMLGITGGLTNLGVATALPGRTDLVLANASALRVGAFRMFVFVALAVTTLYLIQTRRLPGRMRGALLVAVTAVDLWSVARFYWIFSEPAAKLYAGDATTEYVRKQQQPGRVLAFPSAAGVAVNDPNLTDAGLMIHRIRTPLGYHGNELGRYQLLGDHDNGWRSIGNPNFWKLMNVRWVLTNSETLDVPGLKRVAGPITNSAGTQNVTLFEIGEDNPFAWVAPVIVKAPDEQVLATVLDPRFDVRRAALFDTAAAVQGKSVEAGLPEPLAVRVRTTSYAPGRVSLELDQAAPEGSALVVSENYYPGWTATVDGKQSAIGRVDMTLIGVALPAGARKVELSFASRPYEIGKVVTLLALGISLVGWAGGYLVGRRQSA